MYQIDTILFYLLQTMETKVIRKSKVIIYQSMAMKRQ